MSLSKERNLPNQAFRSIVQFRCFESDYKSKNFEKVGAILDLPCPSVIL